MHGHVRKVACSVAWHPSRVSFTVAVAGQRGSHHHTDEQEDVLDMAPIQRKARYVPVAFLHKRKCSGCWRWCRVGTKGNSLSCK